jgi:tRNA(adenine34) deaminase
LTVYFGAYDKKAGSFGSVVNLAELPYNHKPEIYGGLLEKECSNVLSEFFKDLRASKKKYKAVEE